MKGGIVTPKIFMVGRKRGKRKTRFMGLATRLMVSNKGAQNAPILWNDIIENAEFIESVWWVDQFLHFRQPIASINTAVRVVCNEFL